MRKQLIPEMRKQAQESTRPPTVDSGNLDEAIKWVYKRYGTDLPAFFRDAYKEAARKHRESADNVEASPR